VLHMNFHRAFRDAESARDFLVARAAGNELHDFLFAWG
jgi:hypothetical protein